MYPGSIDIYVCGGGGLTWGLTSGILADIPSVSLGWRHSRSSE